MPETSITAEEKQSDVDIITGSNSDKKVVEIDKTTDDDLESDNTSGTTVNNGRSIKMIVGGQSKDGVAKEIFLPVDE